ncbi:DUF2933 domain-containing protein [Novosphingobium sp. JCM 18896]|uniref:DUF2933 domain-containing protein n=1 Tax=Novosphingobium sp. JCM 18896 TaxID=2989731 RepID=UPI002223D917|nr:DUF2933 domain-containing protein [Novosphingobium sp. JCM 18896]MCW1431946.1 DUF2933 domain-containing protein [Novosphingobium sp. JCM 18896]
MDDQSARRAFRGKIVFVGFLLVAGFYLITEHTAHFLGVLPFLIFLACPLMHLFMHGHHGGHAHNHGDSADQSTQTTTSHAQAEGQGQ